MLFYYNLNRYKQVCYDSFYRILRQQLERLTQSPPHTQSTIAYPLQPVVIPNQETYETDSHTGSETSELDWLREDRERMEAKQEVLEAHNKQLELQLFRLRLLLKEVRKISLSHLKLSHLIYCTAKCTHCQEC